MDGKKGPPPRPLKASIGSVEIKLAKGTVRVAGTVDAVVLRTAIECLLA